MTSVQWTTIIRHAAMSSTSCIQTVLPSQVPDRSLQMQTVHYSLWRSNHGLYRKEINNFTWDFIHEFTSLLYLQIHLVPRFNPSFHGGNGEVWEEGEGVHLEASLPRTSIIDGEWSCDYLALCHKATKVHNVGGDLEMWGWGNTKSGRRRGGEWESKEQYKGLINQRTTVWS